VRPVNLLPAQYRSRQSTGGFSGSAYGVVGVLAALLLAATAYVLTSNQVDSRQAKAAEAQQAASAAEARTAELGGFGDFATVKQTRQASVTGLAQVRFDWERVLRELALVLPPGTTIKEADASVTAEDPTTPAAASAAAAAPAGPTVKLTGCAPSQRGVARLMVRLRVMHRVEEVMLEESKLQGGEGAADSSATPVAGAGGGSGAGPGNSCDGGFEYGVTVAFQAAPTGSSVPAGARRVPVALGGGE
jgi:Tfp pilus assembly protein PilN